MAIGVLITVIPSGLWTIGLKNVTAITLWPGMMLGWMFVFGDNINSLDEVFGTITSISLLINGLFGFILGWLLGKVAAIIRGRKKHAHKMV